MKTLSLFLLSFICLVLFTLPVQAQPDPRQPENEDGAVPANWQVRLDKPDKSVIISADKDSADIFFVNMVPGWHITTGPAGIFYHPKSTATGTYTASTKIHLFDPKGRNEAFGIFFGGQNLDRSNQSYIYFLLRNSGQFLVKKRMGKETKLIKDWTNTEAMKTFGPDTESSVPNTLSVQVAENKITFLVNNQNVYSMPAGEITTDGIVGLRINHRLNVHVEDLKVEAL